MAITAVAGNVPLALTQRNARALVELAGKRVPVYAGCEAPWMRKLRTAEHICGATGMDGADLDELALPLENAHAVDAIIAALMNAPDGSVTFARSVRSPISQRRWCASRASCRRSVRW